VIPRTVLLAPGRFAGELSATRVAAALGRGLQAADPSLGVDLCSLQRDVENAEDVRGALDALDFDARMRAARAVVVGAVRLDERTLLGSATFEIATRARQSGVPAYGVTGENALSLFDARILDLQVILEAANPRALRRAGERLAGLI
jgi:glycerate kinase